MNDYIQENIEQVFTQVDAIGTYGKSCLNWPSMTFLFWNQFNLGFVSEHKLDFLKHKSAGESRLNSEKSKKAKIVIFEGKITKMILGMNFQIFKFTLYMIFWRIVIATIAIATMANFRKLAKFIYHRPNCYFHDFFLENENLSLEMKILKFLGIQPTMRVLKLKYFSRKIFCSDNEDYIPLNSVFKLPVVENLTELCVQLDCPGNNFNIDVRE